MGGEGGGEENKKFSRAASQIKSATILNRCPANKRAASPRHEEPVTPAAVHQGQRGGMAETSHTQDGFLGQAQSD